jgi:L-cystine uptake protein TcyP (sodium:dicarboxylate symporter family)
MKEQNFSNHSRILPMFHYLLVGLILCFLIGAGINFYRHYTNHQGMLIPTLLVLGGVIFFLTAFLARTFGLKAQDRAIRAEENLRYFAITGSLLDNRLTLPQIIALRFAPNNELLDLAHKAAEQDMKPKEIKQAIKNWKGDYHRV